MGMVDIIQDMGIITATEVSIRDMGITMPTEVFIRDMAFIMDTAGFTPATAFIMATVPTITVNGSITQVFNSKPPLFLVPFRTDENEYSSFC